MCESVPECTDDCVENDGSGCVPCTSGYSPDGWTGDEWTGDGTTDTTNASWGGDAWQASYSKRADGSSGSGKAAFWGIGAALCALVAGAALFMTRVSFSPRTNFTLDRRDHCIVGRPRLTLLSYRTNLKAEEEPI
jgi:hypothetical protein